MINNIKDIWTEFSKYPLLVNAMIFCIVAFTIFFLAIFTSAHIRGCPISFWLPSIGECPQGSPQSLPQGPEVPQNSNIKKWEGTWTGEANDLTVEGEEEILDSKTGLNQKVNITVKSNKKDKNKIILTGKVISDRPGEISGTSEINNSYPYYITINYKLIGTDGIGESFGTALMHLDPSERSMKGYFLSRRILGGHASQAFGKVELQRTQ